MKLEWYPDNIHKGTFERTFIKEMIGKKDLPNSLILIKFRDKYPIVFKFFLDFIMIL